MKSKFNLKVRILKFKINYSLKIFLFFFLLNLEPKRMSHNIRKSHILLNHSLCLFISRHRSPPSVQVALVIVHSFLLSIFLIENVHMGKQIMHYNHVSMSMWRGNIEKYLSYFKSLIYRKFVRNRTKIFMSMQFNHSGPQQ